MKSKSNTYPTCDDSNSYRVVLNGKIVNGFTKEEVNNNIIKIYGEKFKDIDSFLSGKRIIVKNNVSLEACKKIEGIFKEAGAECLIENAVSLENQNKSKTTNLKSSKVIKFEDYKIFRKMIL